MTNFTAAGVINERSVINMVATLGRGITRPVMLEFANGIFANMPLVISLVNACRTVKLLSLDFEAEDEDPDLLPALGECLANHSGIQGLTINNLEKNTCMALWRTMAGIPGLESAVVHGKHSDQILTISVAEEANVLASVLALPSLEYTCIADVCLANEEVANIVMESFTHSRLKKLVINNLIVPKASETSLADTLTRTSLWDLISESLPSPDFLRALGDGLARPTTTIRTLSLGYDYAGRGCFINSSSLCAFLRGSRHWTIRYLTLHLNDWDESFDKELAKYVKHNSELRELSLFLSPDYSGPEIYSAALVDAMEWGVRTVGFIDLRRAFAPAFAEKLDHIIKFNGKLELHDPLFDKILAMDRGVARRMSLLEALALFDLEFLFKCIQRNEWTLQQLLQESCMEDHG